MCLDVDILGMGSIQLLFGFVSRSRCRVFLAFKKHFSDGARSCWSNHAVSRGVFWIVTVVSVGVVGSTERLFALRLLDGDLLLNVFD